MTGAFGVAAAGIISAVCAVIVRKQVPELGMLLAICAGVMILLSCSGALSVVIDFVDELVTVGGIAPGIVAPVLKVMGISVVVRLSADFCKDAKEGAVATAVETVGAVLSLVAVLPLISAVLDLLGSMM